MLVKMNRALLPVFSMCFSSLSSDFWGSISVVFLGLCRRLIAFQPILSSRDWTASEYAAEVYQLIVVASMGRCQKPVDFGMPCGDP